MIKFKFGKAKAAVTEGKPGNRASRCPSCDGTLYEQVHADMIAEKTKFCGHTHDVPAIYDACVEHHLFKSCDDNVSVSKPLNECEISQLLLVFAEAKPEHKEILHRAIWSAMRDNKSNEIGQAIMAKLKGKIPPGDVQVIGMEAGPDEDEILSKPVGKKETFH